MTRAEISARFWAIAAKSKQRHEAEQHALRAKPAPPTEPWGMPGAAKRGALKGSAVAKARRRSKGLAMGAALPPKLDDDEISEGD